MSRYINPRVAQKDYEFTAANFKKAFPEIHEEIERAGYDAGKKDGHKAGYAEGLAAGKATAMKEIAAQKAKTPTPEELAKIEAALPLEEKAKRRWLRDPELREQYKMSGFSGFLATLKHEAKTAGKR